MNKVRLFIDPASKSSGWALFKGKKLLKSGTVEVKGQVWDRLAALSWRYTHLFSGKTWVDCQEAHIEQFGGRPHRYLVFSVGVIGAAVANIATEVEQDIPVSSWQKYCDWKGKGLILDPYRDKVDSEDELSAIGMGLWYVNARNNVKSD